MRQSFCITLLLTGCVLLPAQAADDFKLEDGFTALFNGKDLDGWRLVKGKESLAGKTETATKRFVVGESTLSVDGKVKGDITIETEKQFDKDAHIKFDFRPGKGCNNDLYFRGLKFDLKISDVKNMKEGEWNSFEIIVTGDEAEFKNNGESIKKAKAKPGATSFGIRAEFGPIDVRRVRIRN